MSIARITDIGVGVCVSHITPIPMTGVISTGSTNTFVDSLGVATTGSVVIGACGHIGIIATSSSKIFVNSLGVARLGDSFAGAFSGVITSASEDVIGS